jgi:hypothetical protein
MEIMRCVSCDGYGWVTDEESPDQAQDCGWCRGVGYVYRGADGIDRPIPAADLPRLALELETLEHQRLREMGYTGEAKHPSQQGIRRSQGA